MRLFEHDTTTPTRVGILGISIPLPFVSAADEAVVIRADDDDPATLARLAAIMSESVRSCPRCGRETHICAAIGCDIDDAPLLAALTA